MDVKSEISPKENHPNVVAGVLKRVLTLAISFAVIFEDRTLQAELPGYPEYARKVRYRLVPGIW